MVSKTGSNDYFFTIKTRDSKLRVPQKIFPKSKVIDDVIEPYKKTDMSDVSFYINRNTNDMCEVLNFLSGQTYDKNKENIIEEILQQDFDINIKSDEKKNDVRMMMKDFNKNKESAILSMWNDFIETTQFIITIEYHPRKQTMFTLMLHNKNLFEAMDQYRKSAGERKKYCTIQSTIDVSEIKSKYEKIAEKYHIDIIKEIIELSATNYQFLSFKGHKSGKLQIVTCDFENLKYVVRDAEVAFTNSQDYNVSFYLK
jgi:hypothetical protein